MALDDFITVAQLEEYLGISSAAAADEVQLVALTGFSLNGDSFKITFGGQESALIVRGTNYTTTDIASAIAAINGFLGTVVVSALTDAGFTVTFAGAYASANVSQLSITSATGCSGSVSTTTQGNSGGGSGLDPAVAALLIVQAQASIRSWLDQDVTQVAGRIEFIDGSGRDSFRLKQRPVTAVTELQEDGVVTAPGTYPDHDWFYNGDSGVVIRQEGTWRVGRGNLKATYASGWAAADVPADIVLIGLNLARRIYNEVGETTEGGAVTSETIGAYSYTNGTSDEAGAGTGIALSKLEKAVLDKYRMGGPRSGSRS